MNRVKMHLLFLLLFFSIAFYAAADDLLWQKSLDLFSRNSSWHPGTMLVRTKEFDDAGKLRSTAYTEIEYKVSNEGELESEVINAVKDGRDITEKQNRGRRKEENPFIISPFNPEFQESIVVTPTDDSKQVGNSLCRRFDLSLEYDKRHYTGTAWLEKKTGAPLLLILRMESLPVFLDSMTMTFHYTFLDKGTWYASRIEMEGSGTILFQKKIFYSETTLANHFRFIPREGTGEGSR